MKYFKTVFGRLKQLSSYADQALVSGSNFIIGLLLARFLGLAEYGTYSLLWMLVLFASSMQQSIVIAPLFSLHAKQTAVSDWVKQMVGLQFWFSLLALIVAIFIAFLSSHFDLGFEWNTAILILPFVIVSFITNDFFRRLHFLNGKGFFAFLIDAVGYGLQPVSFIGLHYLGLLDLTNVFIVIVVLQSISSFVGYLLSNTAIKNPSKAFLLEVWNYSKYLAGTSVLHWLSGNYFLIAAGSLIGASAVGAVKIAQNIMGVLHVLFLAMENKVPVTAARFLEENGLPKMMQYFRKVTLQTALPLVVLIGLIALARKELLWLLFNVTETVNAEVLLAFCGVYILVFIGTQLRFIIRSVHRNQLIFWSYVLTSVFSLFSAKMIVQQFDVMGVVLGIAMTHIMSLALYFYALKSELKWLLK